MRRISSVRLVTRRALFPSRPFSTTVQRLQNRKPVQHKTQSRTPGFARKQTPSSRPVTSKSNPTSPPSSQNPDAALSTALQKSAASHANPANLLAPVHVPSDPHSILPSNHPSTPILANSSILIHRQLETLNLLLGIEQANKYTILDGTGNTIGYLAERDHGFGTAVARQAFRTHRSFTTHVFDVNQREVLRFHRPFAWISSRIRVYDATRRAGDAAHVVSSESTALQDAGATNITPAAGAEAQISPLQTEEMQIIGEAQQEWAPLRRKYNLFLHRDASDQTHQPTVSGELALTPSQESGSSSSSFTQFAHVSEPFLSWDFSLLSSTNSVIGSVNRNFQGFAREIFTDTGVYALRMDSAHLAPELGLAQQQDEAAEAERVGMTLDQRAVMLATAVSIDYDYFSKLSDHRTGGVGTFMPLWFPWGGAGGAGGAAEAGAAEAGAAEAGAVATEGEAGAGMAAAEEATRTARDFGGPMAGAGTLAGYEAMQRGMGRGSSEDGGDIASGDGGRADGDAWRDGWLDEDAASGGRGGEVGGGGDGDGGGFFDDFDF